MFKNIGYLEYDKMSKLAAVSQKLRTELITYYASVFQNVGGPFAIVNGRSMTTTWFKRKLANGEEVNRSRLLYSPKKEAAYCFFCMLFISSTNSNYGSSFALADGFKRWRKAEKLAAHEISFCHHQSFTNWKEAKRNIINRKGIDKKLEDQIQTEKQRWRYILKRVLSCIKFIASQNLAQRGHKKSWTNEDARNGNFLPLVKLIAQYDPVLGNHLKHTTENPGSVSYLLSEIQNEFFSILASTVRNQLLSNIRKNKYYGILLDSTPVIGHREQLSQMIRFVDINFMMKKVSIKESFLGFIEIHAKDAATLETVIVEKIEYDNTMLR